MGTLTRTAGRVLGAAVVVLAGAGILVLAGAGIANAQPAGTSACQKLTTTEVNLNTAVAKMVKEHRTVQQAVAVVATQLTQAASTAPAAVKSAVSTFVADLQAGAAAGHFDTAKINADVNAVTAACATAQTVAPSGAPATGGGSAAGVRDPALFGVGGAAVLAGLGALGLARRNRPRSSPGHG
jgi:hypothetical protein